MNILYPPAYNVTFLGNNPFYKEQYWSASGIAPHASTDRIQYNILAGKRGIITNIFMCVLRNTAAAPVGRVAMGVQLNYGAGQHSVARIDTLNNTPQVSVVFTLSSQIYVPAGTVIWANTLDLGTGGTNDYIFTINFIEVDP